MKAFPDLPSEVETELGKATIGVVQPMNALKEYLCPLCDGEIVIGELHVIVVPVHVPRLRRHVHGECLKEFIDQKLTIKLHPNEPNAVKFHL